MRAAARGPQSSPRCRAAVLSVVFAAMLLAPAESALAEYWQDGDHGEAVEVVPRLPRAGVEWEHHQQVIESVYQGQRIRIRLEVVRQRIQIENQWVQVEEQSLQIEVLDGAPSPAPPNERILDLSVSSFPSTPTGEPAFGPDGSIDVTHLSYGGSFKELVEGLAAGIGGAAEALLGQHQRRRRMQEIGRQMYKAYRESLQINGRWVQAVHENLERSRARALTEEREMAAAVGRWTSAIPNRTSQELDLAALSLVARYLESDPLADRHYDLSPEVEAEVEGQLRTSLDAGAYHRAAEMAERLLYQTDPERAAAAATRLGELVNDQGVLVFENADPTLPPSPLASTPLRTPRDALGGQQVRRVANQFQADWAERGGLAGSPAQTQYPYLAGLAVLQMADVTLSGGLDPEEGSGLLRVSQGMLEISKGFIEGFVGSFEEMAELVPALEKILSDHAAALARGDTDYLVESGERLIASLPGMVDAVLLASLELKDVILEGSAYERSRLLGQVAADVAVGMATGGAIGALRHVARGGRMIEALGKSGRALREGLSALGDSHLSRRLGERFRGSVDELASHPALRTSLARLAEADPNQALLALKYRKPVLANRPFGMEPLQDTVPLRIEGRRVDRVLNRAVPDEDLAQLVGDMNVRTFGRELETLELDYVGDQAHFVGSTRGAGGREGSRELFESLTGRTPGNGMDRHMIWKDTDGHIPQLEVTWRAEPGVPDAARLEVFDFDQRVFEEVRFGDDLTPNVRARSWNEEQIRARVQSRIEVVDGPTRTTPQRKGGVGEPFQGGFRHVRQRHFGNITNDVSAFTIEPDEVLHLLESPRAVNAPIQPKDASFTRVVTTDRIIGRTRIADGGRRTHTIEVVTDPDGKLLTVYPVPDP